MPSVLAAKFAGLPRWAWLAIIAGGLTVGLILRSRDTAASNAQDAANTDLTDNGDGTYTDANGNITDQYGNILTASGYDPNSFDYYGGTIPYPPGSGSTSTTFQTPPAPDPRIPCTSPPPNTKVTGYTWVCNGTYWEMKAIPGSKGTPCTQAPPGKPPTGFEWQCIGSVWQLRNVKPTSGGGPTPCWKLPPHTAPSGYKWKCVSGNWQLDAVQPAPPPKDNRVPCATDAPPYKPPDGFHWECNKGFWDLQADHKKHHHDGSKNDHGKCHGPKPTKAMNGHHWKCQCNDKGTHCEWQQVRLQDSNSNGNKKPQRAPVTTGGGPPSTRDIHKPGSSSANASR